MYYTCFLRLIFAVNCCKIVGFNQHLLAFLSPSFHYLVACIYILFVVFFLIIRLWTWLIVVLVIVVGFLSVFVVIYHCWHPKFCCSFFYYQIVVCVTLTPVLVAFLFHAVLLKTWWYILSLLNCSCGGSPSPYFCCLFLHCLIVIRCTLIPLFLFHFLSGRFTASFVLGWILLLKYIVVMVIVVLVVFVAALYCYLQNLIPVLAAFLILGRSSVSLLLQQSILLLNCQFDGSHAPTICCLFLNCGIVVAWVQRYFTYYSFIFCRILQNYQAFMDMCPE